MTIFTFAPYELFSVAKGLSTTNYTLIFDNHLISYYDIKVVLLLYALGNKYEYRTDIM